MSTTNPSTSTVRAHLMHFVPYNECSANPKGGFDLKQASSIRVVGPDGHFTQSCGVQVAVTTPLNASRLWCRIEVLHSGKTVQTDKRELNASNSAQTRYPEADIWSFDQRLSFQTLDTGLCRIRLYLSLSPDHFDQCQAESFIYLVAPAPTAQSSPQKVFQVKLKGGPSDGQETFVASLDDEFLVPRGDPRSAEEIMDTLRREGRQAVGWQYATSGSVYKLESSDTATPIQRATYVFVRELTIAELTALRKQDASQREGEKRMPKTPLDALATDEVTMKELDRLPNWASVAFAAQCAELLWPCYLNLPADMERWTGLSVRKAIDLAKEAAQEGRARDLVEPETVAAAAEAVSSATNQRAGFHEMREAAECAAEAAAYALTAARSPKVAAMYAEKAAGRFHYAVVWIWPHLRGKAREYYNYLLDLAERNNWNKDTILPREIVDNGDFDPPPFQKWPQPGLHTAADKEYAERVRAEALEFLRDRERKLMDDMGTQ